MRISARNSDRSYSAWTVKKLHTFLDQCKAPWQQGMKKATLVTLCEQQRLDLRRAVNQDGGGTAKRCSGRGQPAAESIQEGEDKMDETENTAASSSSSELQEFPATQVSFMEKLAETVALATVKALQAQSKAPHSQAATPQNQSETAMTIPPPGQPAGRSDKDDLRTAPLGDEGNMLERSMQAMAGHSSYQHPQDLVSSAVQNKTSQLIPNTSAANANLPFPTPQLGTGACALTNNNNNKHGLPDFPSPEGNLMGQSGVSVNSLPSADFVSPSLRRDILSGKDICLAALMIPDFKESVPKEVILGGDTFSIKAQNDKRLTRPLTIHEFSLAFNKYKNILCEVYPTRRKELDDYHSSILRMAQQYGGQAFYDYHKQFSFKASQFLLQKGIKVDWSIRDAELFMAIFTGLRVNSCNTCGSSAHTTNFCEEIPSGGSHFQKGGYGGPNFSNKRLNTPKSDIDSKGRRVFTLRDGKQICNNYNSEQNCVFGEKCHFVHICTGCKKAHPKQKCPEASKVHPSPKGFNPNAGKQISTITSRP
jgi:hypothetical protein